MVELELQIDDVVVSLMREAVRRLASRVNETRTRQRFHAPESDEEMSAIWQQELAAARGEDARLVLALLERPQFGHQPIQLPVEEAEACVRACSALRLMLRDDDLRGVPDETLEAGELAPDAFPEAQQEGYLVYLLLMALQAALIEGLDPDAARG